MTSSTVGIFYFLKKYPIFKAKLRIKGSNIAKIEGYQRFSKFQELSSALVQNPFINFPSGTIAAWSKVPERYKNKKYKENCTEIMSETENYVDNCYTKS